MNEYPYTDGLRTLLSKLWVERHTLELLAYKLTCAKLIMAGDIRRYVAPALAGPRRSGARNCSATISHRCLRQRRQDPHWPGR